MNDCLTTPQHKNKSAVGCQTNGVYMKRNFPFLSDFSLKLVGPAARVTYTQTVVFTCTVRYAADLNDDVCFRNADGYQWCMRQAGDSCSELVPDIGYSCSCDNGTHNRLSKNKIYTLRITLARSKDAGEWHCHLKMNKVHSNGVNLTVHPGRYTVCCCCFYFDCLRSSKEGKSSSRFPLWLSLSGFLSHILILYHMSNAVQP